MTKKPKGTMLDWLVSFIYKVEGRFSCEMKALTEDDFLYIERMIRKLKKNGFVEFSHAKGEGEERVRFYKLTKIGFKKAKEEHARREQEASARSEPVPEVQSIGKKTISVSWRESPEDLKRFKNKFIQLNLL